MRATDLFLCSTVTTSNILMTKLRSTDADDILHALNLYEMGQHQQVLGAVQSLLDHPVPSIRSRAITVLRGVWGYVRPRDDPESVAR